MATKGQRELAVIYCHLTDLREAMEVLREGIVDPKYLASEDFKAVKELKKPNKISKFMMPDDAAENDEESTWLWLSWHISTIAQATQDLRHKIGVI